MVDGRDPSGDSAAMDVYLQPHSDDICFSLGALAHHRHRGMMLTAFPKSGYVAARPGFNPPPADVVTRTRIAEDQAFAAACGLDTRFLDVSCATLLGHRSRDLSWVEENALRIQQPLLNALHALGGGQGKQMRPWLFCPSGIGGHVDHVAIRMVVTREYEGLAALYRVAFYEDLPYASNKMARHVGLARLFEALPGIRLRRFAWELRDALPNKLFLMRLYPSQFREVPSDIGEYTQSSGIVGSAHEAIWSEAPRGPLSQ
jgi:hypothetical protein